jgi:hypothetical protein
MSLRCPGGQSGGRECRAQRWRHESSCSGRRKTTHAVGTPFSLRARLHAGVTARWGIHKMGRASAFGHTLAILIVYQAA